MTDPSHRLDLVILSRLATAGPRPLSTSKLEGDLFPFVEARLSRGEWSSRCAERLEALRTSGDLDERRQLTEAGLSRIRQSLGVLNLPTKWAQIWQALLPALALELPGAQWSELTSAGKLRARIIRQHRALELSATPTLAQTVDAQAWQELGSREVGKLGVQKVKLALMQQALGVPVRSIGEAVNAWCWTLLGEAPRVDFPMGRLRRVLLEKTLGTQLRATTLDAAKVGEWLATDAVGATKRDINTVRRALVGRWLSGEAERPRAPEPAPEPSMPADGLSLEAWARTVEALAAATASGRYGDERVFIASVWRSARDEDALHEPLDAFKARLIEANRAGLLRLHRADLVGAMDPALVDESETRHLNAIFHFIEIPSRSTP